MTNSPHYSGVNLAATALLEYEVRTKQWHTFQSPFAEWLNAILNNPDYATDLPREVIRRWGKGWTKPEEIILVTDLAEWARDPYVRHAKAIIQLALRVSITREQRDEESVNSLLAGIADYRSATDDAWAALTEAERDAEA